MSNWDIVDNTKAIETYILVEMAKAHKELQDKVLATAKANAPVDTGDLRRSINASAKENFGRGIFFGIIWIGAEYGVFVHEGFLHILSGRRIPANPFLRNALIEHWPAYIARCEQIFKEALG